MVKTNQIKKNGILVQLIVRDSCSICKRVQESLEQFYSEYQGIDLHVFDLENGAILPKKLQSFITPAVWVNGALWYLGGFDYQRFVEKIDLLNLDKNPINKHYVVSS